MLIVPLTGKWDWKNPPWITLLLIFINFFVYFVLQSGDAAKHKEARAFYFISGLGEIETGTYMNYLKAANRESEIKVPVNVRDEVVVAYLHNKMERDGLFIGNLMNDEIITPSAPVYPKWKELRNKYGQLQSKVVAWRYGYKPQLGGIETLFTSMFLHGDVFHLLGNMLFLWLVGCAIELAGRRAMYAVIYLATGVCATFGYGMVYSHSAIPLVGASGAIAGIMGAYTVLFGMRKIKIFYSLGFYFSNTRVRAIFLLPVWLGMELFDLFIGGESGVAYVAHIAGLISGGALSFADLKLFGPLKAEDPAEERREKLALLIERGLAKLAELDLKGARALILEALQLEPGNTATLTHLFNIDKLSPESAEFHETAGNLLHQLSRDESRQEAMVNVYTEYCRVSGQPRLTPDLCSRLSSAFSNRGQIEQSEKMVAMLLKNSPQFPALPTVLLNLSRACLRSGLREKGEKIIAYLCSKYPGSTESQIARGLIR